MTPEHPRTWRREITPLQWKTLLAAQVGWMLDAMDVMLYAFALTAIRSEFSLSSATAGALASVTLLASALGGAAAGVLADRFGRSRMLVIAVLVYSVFTAATATARGLGALILWRALVGIGLGAEWTAGSVLVAETWPPQHRGKAIGLMQSGWAIGYMLAAGLAAAVLPRYGWRPLFLIGVLPALFAAWVRRSVPEPEIWARQRTAVGTAGAAAGRDRLSPAAIFRPPLLARTLAATAMGTALLCAYWGLFTWIPTYLASPVEGGGAGLGVVRSSTWIIVMQAGAFLGYTLFGVLADRFGRRKVFLAFVLGAAILVPVYGLCARSQTTLLILGPLVGFLGHGYFSVFGALLAELFPSAIRATAQGFCYNIGRAASAGSPLLIGALADRFGIGSALAVTSLFYLLGAVCMLLLPETRGEVLS
jgi:MFS family permease